MNLFVHAFVEFISLNISSSTHDLLVSYNNIFIECSNAINCTIGREQKRIAIWTDHDCAIKSETIENVQKHKNKNIKKASTETKRLHECYVGDDAMSVCKLGSERPQKNCDDFNECLWYKLLIILINIYV